MGKDISFKNHDRFIHLGIAIAALRKMRGMSQEQLAEKAGISRSLISAIEAPGLAKSFSLDVFFNLADALDIDPADLINARLSLFFHGHSPWLPVFHNAMKRGCRNKTTAPFGNLRGNGVQKIRLPYNREETFRYRFLQSF